MFELKRRKPASADKLVDDESPSPTRSHRHHHSHQLQWICSPVVEEERIPVDHELAAKVAQEPISLFEDSEFDPASLDTEHSAETIVHPIFQRNHESTPLELFYDLFFVANLTAFTSEHEINSGANMRSYLGFFAVLWFTWFNVSLYDLRLARDSVFDRVCKAIQFGVMIGFAAVGAEFTPNTSEADNEVFSNNSFMAILLMISRITLCIQYSVCLVFLRRYRAAYTPMIITIVTTFLAAVAYMATLFAFPPFTDDRPKTYIVWYFICGVETALTLFAAMKWRMLSFKKTHVVERMSLLTLIILGEGVIGLAEAVQMAIKSNVTGNTDNITSTTKSFNGGLVAAVLILYFLYMLYFDWVPEEHFGTIREQIWAWFHFPLHMALVLCVEGSAQALKWRRIIQQMNVLDRELETLDIFQGTVLPLLTGPNVSDTTYINNVATFLNSRNQTESAGEMYFSQSSQNLTYLYNNLTENTGAGSIQNYAEALEALQTVQDGANGMNATQIFIAVDQVYENAIGNVLDAFGAELPNSTAESCDFAGVFPGSGEDGQDVPGMSPDQSELMCLLNKFDSVSHLFDFAFEYFFVSAGLVLICLGILAMLATKKRWHFWDWFRFSSYYFFGIALALITLTYNTDLPGSAWVLPLVALVFFVNVVTNHI